jgi:hypothetical protein
MNRKPGDPVRIPKTWALELEPEPEYLAPALDPEEP